MQLTRAEAATCLSEFRTYVRTSLRAFERRAATRLIAAGSDPTLTRAALAGTVDEILADAERELALPEERNNIQGSHANLGLDAAADA